MCAGSSRNVFASPLLVCCLPRLSPTPTGTSTGMSSHWRRDREGHQSFHHHSSSRKGQSLGYKSRRESWQRDETRQPSPQRRHERIPFSESSAQCRSLVGRIRLSRSHESRCQGVGARGHGSERAGGRATGRSINQTSQRKHCNPQSSPGIAILRLSCRVSASLE